MPPAVFHVIVEPSTIRSTLAVSKIHSHDPSHISLNNLSGLSRTHDVCLDLTHAIYVLTILLDTTCNTREPATPYHGG